MVAQSWAFPNKILYITGRSELDLPEENPLFIGMSFCDEIINALYLKGKTKTCRYIFVIRVAGTKP